MEDSWWSWSVWGCMSVKEDWRSELRNSKKKTKSNETFMKRMRSIKCVLEYHNIVWAIIHLEKHWASGQISKWRLSEKVKAEEGAFLWLGLRYRGNAHNTWICGSAEILGNEYLTPSATCFKERHSIAMCKSNQYPVSYKFIHHPEACTMAWKFWKWGMLRMS